MTDEIQPACQNQATEPLGLSVRVIPFAVGTTGLDIALAKDRHAAERHTVTLPHGTLKNGESLGTAASRISRGSLSVPPDYLEQLYTFSGNGAQMQAVVTYFALLSADTRAAVERSDQVTFRFVEALDCLSGPDMQIVEYAKTRLRAKLGYSNVAFHLLPREFTLSDLQDVYESVLGQSLDKRNFRRRVLAAEIIESVGTMRPTKHRPATLYRFIGGDPAHGSLTPDELDWNS